MGIEESFGKVASLCAHEVVPTGIPCCGMAGEKNRKEGQRGGEEGRREGFVWGTVSEDRRKVRFQEVKEGAMKRWGGVVAI